MNLADESALIEFLKQNRLSPKKKFGQNFLVDQSALDDIIKASELNQSDEVIEIGPGPGALTRELIQKAKRITAVELDPEMVAALKLNCADANNLEIQNVDIRTFQIPAEEYKLIANIPYYLTSPILRKFYAESQNRPKIAVLLIQKEVAEKIVDKKRSVLSWQVEIFGIAKIVKIVPAKSFLPPPKVESAVIQIKLRDKPLIPESQIIEFFQVLHLGFRAPRKKICGSLIAGLPMEKNEVRKIFEKSEVNPELRPGDLEINDWLKLAKVFPQK